VQHTHPEKQKFRTPDGISSMNQIPEELLDILIKASSNEGDVVLDPFCGTGSTAASALRLGRGIITIDQSDNYLQVALNRVKGL
jgi:site-specific DNA-methyltransferase (adenine-specific)